MNSSLTGGNGDVDIEMIAINPDIELKRGLIQHIQTRIKKLKLRTHILRLKYKKYKVLNDRIQIFIISVSALLTVLETVKSEVSFIFSSIFILVEYLNLVFQFLKDLLDHYL